MPEEPLRTILVEKVLYASPGALAMDRYHRLLSVFSAAKSLGMTLVLAVPCGLLASVTANAHGPFLNRQPVYSNTDLIPSLGSNLPSYRARYNRPRYLGGKIAYHIEPTSQEAMSWHRAVHRGYYANHAPRMEDKYFYPKPWEALTVGPRLPMKAANGAEQAAEVNAARDAEDIPSPEGSRDNDRNHANDELPPAISPLPVPNP